MKSIYEEAGGTYTRQGDYELPNLKVPPEKWRNRSLGQRYRRYLKQHHRIRYYNLLTAGKLNEQLAEVDQQAEWMFQSLVSGIFQAGKCHRKAESRSPYGMVQKMNNIRNRASEIVNNELLYIWKNRNFIFIFRKLSEDFLSKISFGFRASCGRKGAIPTL